MFWELQNGQPDRKTSVFYAFRLKYWRKVTVCDSLHCFLIHTLLPSLIFNQRLNNASCENSLCKALNSLALDAAEMEIIPKLSYAWQELQKSIQSEIYSVMPKLSSPAITNLHVNGNLSLVCILGHRSKERFQMWAWFLTISIEIFISFVNLQ